MKKLLAVSSATGLVLVGGLWFYNRGPSDLSNDDSAKLSSPVGKLVAGVSSGEGSSGARGPAAVSPAGGAGAAAVGSENSAVREAATDLSNFKFERQEDLNLFRDLNKRVLPSEDDRAEKERLFKDAEFLKALANLLKTQNMNEDTLKNQNIAVDLLIEAMDSQSSEAATILQSVVMDSQVENAAIPQAARENLAGLKAEVLFQWSARDPKASAQLQSMLPGPVSQKIWANVVQRQQSNLAESKQEIKRK